MTKYLVLIATVVALGHALHYGDEGIDVKINVEKNSNSYLSGRLPQGSFEYGLDVVKQKDNHFQHKVKGPDDVTYGCYGFVDPDGKPHLVHYVSDLKGYRIVPPDSATKIYISRLERSINNVYQASQEKNVQWKDLFFPPACKQLYTETKTVAPPTTPRPAPRTPSTTRRPAPTTRRVTPAPPPPPQPAVPEPEFTASSNLCPSVVQAPPANLVPQPACSKVCDELKDELKDIKAKLKNLLDTLAEKPKGRGAGGDGAKFAYFPVMLSDGLPDGVDPSSAKFAFPTLPQQCGRQ